MVKRWINRYGEKFTEELLNANNAKPKISLRINNLVTDAQSFTQEMQKVKLSYKESKYLKGFYNLKSLSNITDWDLFQNGHFTIQDESTGFACLLLDVKPDMKVLDFCAAPGGKTALLADFMENKGEIIALDKYESRIKILSRNLERLNVKNVTPVVADSLEYSETGFDRILLDVPCSGLGTITKKPDIKWKRDIGDFRKLNHTQKELLNKAATLLKHGGYIVYSTCTIEPDENYNIIKEFLNNNPDYELVNAKEWIKPELVDENGCLQTYPHINNMDGAFAAKIKRK